MCWPASATCGGRRGLYLVVDAIQSLGILPVVAGPWASDAASAATRACCAARAWYVSAGARRWSRCTWPRRRSPTRARRHASYQRASLRDGVPARDRHLTRPTCTPWQPHWRCSSGWHSSIERQALASDRLLTGLDRLGRAVGPRDRERIAHPGARPGRSDVDGLLAAQGVAQRGGIRVSFGLFNTEADVDRLLETLSQGPRRH
jgi:hypothetical protein